MEYYFDHFDYRVVKTRVERNVNRKRWAISQDRVPNALSQCEM